MNIAVIYESKYGYTEKYARWIADSLSCDLYHRKSMKPPKLAEYDTIIYGGGLYAGGVSGISLLTQNYEAIQHKNIVLFTCGLADPADSDNVAGIRKSLSQSLTPEMMNNIKIFHLRGGMDYSKLGIVHRSMMAMLHNMIKKKDYETLSSEDKEMLATYGQVVDFTDPMSAQPLIDYVKSL